jgi:beta-glucosidase
VVTPVKELKGFQKILLKPGEKQRVRFKLNREQFSLLDEHLRRKAEPGLFEVQVGASSRDIRLKGHFELSAK